MKKILIAIIMFCFCMLNVSNITFANTSNLDDINNDNVILSSEYDENNLISTNEYNFITNTIYTPNGSEVLVKQYTEELDDETINNIIENFQDGTLYTGAILIGPPTTAYNCHSYAWYSQDIDSNNYWMPSPEQYYLDESYYEVDYPRPNDIICYFKANDTETEADDKNIHSGIVDSLNEVDVNDENYWYKLVNVKSKWGDNGLVYHRGDMCLYGPRVSGSSDYVKFYRPRTDNTYNLSTSMTELNISKAINANGSRTDKYGMFELNSLGNDYYVLTVEGNNSLDVRFYNANMNSKAMPLISSSGNTYQYLMNAAYGINYLRVAYSNLSNSGTISISIEPHVHQKTYVSIGSSKHRVSCYCGYREDLLHVYDEHYCSYCEEYTEIHNYDRNYVWLNYVNHSVECSCGDVISAGHAVRSGTNICLLCGGRVNIGFVEIQSLPDDTYITENGSYILPNGIIILVDMDIEEFLNGTLVFYKKSENIIK